MKAIVYHRYGDPSVLSVEEMEKPQPKPDELLIKVKAVEATKSDCEMRSFKFAVKWFWLPLRLAFGVFKPRRPVLGSYFSGEVESVGNEVRDYKPGQQIFGCCGMKFGAYAEYICLPANYVLATKPVNISFEQAAVIPLGGLNALHFMRRANIQKGDKVLINGAGGSIGTFGLQIAKSMGAEVTVIDSGIKEAMLRRIGADHFIDYSKQSFAEKQQYYDVVFDMVAKSCYSDCINVLKPAGRYLTANPTLLRMIRSMVTSKLSDKKAMVAFAPETKEALVALKKMVESGALIPEVDKTFTMEQAAEAHRLVDTEQRLGTIVIWIVGQK